MANLFFFFSVKYIFYCHFGLVTTTDESGEKICSSQYTIFLVGSGNFGGKRNSSAEKLTKPVPKRAPDAVVEQKTQENQVKSVALKSFAG